MSPIVLAVLAIAVFLILSLNGLPVAFSFAVVGTVTVELLRLLSRLTRILSSLRDYCRAMIARISASVSRINSPLTSIFTV